MVIGVLKESGNDKRVSLVPANVKALLDLKVSKVIIEKDAGTNSFITDKAYENAGATTHSRQEVIAAADILLTINGPTEEDFAQIATGKVLLGAFNPLSNKPLVEKLASAGISSFSLDVIPRTTRAQMMDVLSSMATVAGYKAVLTAAYYLPSMFPMLMTAAGTVIPAKTLILGAGVAGLQAIATAKRLGSSVEVFDVRAAAKEEVLSLGAKFVEVEGAVDDKSAGGYAVEQSEEFKQKQAAKVQEHAILADVIVCTAQIPGRKAPLLITKETIEKMKPGSVIVDLAASTGGNSALTENNKIIQHKGVTIVGDSNLASSIPCDASQLFGKNIFNFLKLIINKEGELNLNFEDELVIGTNITHNKEIVHPRLKAAAMA